MLVAHVLFHLPASPVALDLVAVRCAPCLDTFIRLAGGEVEGDVPQPEAPSGRSMARTRRSAITFQKSGRW